MIYLEHPHRNGTTIENVTISTFNTLVLENSAVS